MVQSGLIRSAVTAKDKFVDTKRSLALSLSQSRGSSRPRTAQSRQSQTRAPEIKLKKDLCEELTVKVRNSATPEEYAALFDSILTNYPTL